VTGLRLLVVVVDDDRSVREALPELLHELGFAVRAFSSAESFLEASDIDRAACVLVDLAMPGATGLDLMDEMQRRGLQVPVVLMTAHTSDAYRRRLLESRAVACLFKPFGEAELLGAIRLALRRDI
jgi:FixJ family two-component response regulator